MKEPRHLRSRRVLVSSGSANSPSSELVAADVVISGGRISAVNEHGSLAEPVEDFGDAVVMPSALDTHVHVNSPGRADWEGFECATRAAAAGGIGAIFDMPLNSRPVTVSAEAYRSKAEAAAGRCRVDVGLYGGLVPENAGFGDTPSGARQRETLGRLLGTGAWAIKAFLCDSGLEDFGTVGEPSLAWAMPQIAAADLGLLAHAEIVDGPSPVSGRSYRAYLESRPPSFELAAIELLIALCRQTDCPVHVVHLSTADALPSLRAARREGLPITVETCPHYLYFCAEDIADGETCFKCAPPIREAANRERLWQGLKEGDIDWVASDHSPCPPGLRDLDRGDLASAWGGISSLQLLLPATWTAARERGFGVAELADWLCSRPAAHFGLSAERGTIAPGLSADFVVWQPEREFLVDGRCLEHRHSETPYQGRRLQGVVERTILRGQDVFVATEGEGRFPGPAIGRLIEKPRPEAGELGSRRREGGTGEIAAGTVDDPVDSLALDSLAPSDLRAQLAGCCGSRRWVDRMVRRAPFGALPALLESSEEAFDELEEADWLEGFAAHPRIGERLESTAAAHRPAEEVSAVAAAFSQREQSASAGADPAVVAELAEANQRYEQRFGFVFLIFASGKSSEQILSILQRRLPSTREQEIAAAAGEQRKITRQRLAQVAEQVAERVAWTIGPSNP